MDKDWVLNPNRVSREYLDGARRFANMAQAREGNPEKILCPCCRCLNGSHQHFDKVYEHLVINGMDPAYKVWVFHGEDPVTHFSLENDNEDMQMANTYQMYRDVYFDDDTSVDIENTSERREEEFRSMLKGVEVPLYPGCTKYTKISALVALYRHKAMHNLSDIGFEELLKLINSMLPQNSNLPRTSYEAKKIFKTFDLGYEKIHACINDCIIFRKEFEFMDQCPNCKTSRWKRNERTNKIRKGVPAKVLRYFPIIPRLRRMFRTPDKAEQLRWHSKNKSQDRKMRHPVDSLAWSTIDEKYPNFSIDPRNLRLGLSTDGFNPFGDLSSKYSCWPVILVNYNLPPWLCMSKENMLLTLLIPGSKQPGNDIDVYLQPLIEDLKELWDNGVEIFDAFSKSMFNLKAILMWTISDFPALGNLYGYATKSGEACPVCTIETTSQRLSSSQKSVFMGHRRFLRYNHPFRKKKSWFNGKEELKASPKILSGSEVWQRIKDFENVWGKTKQKRNEKTYIWPWKKKSIFFELPYWNILLLRHNLDVMHIEKNVCESIIGTLLNIKGKSKDGLNSRLDMKDMCIRNELHPQESGKKYFLPPAPYTMSNVEKKLFCKRLKHMKLPDGYGSNIGHRVSLDDNKIMGLKSHDCHLLMQQLLSVALQGILPKGPRIAIYRLCAYFNEICQKVVDRRSLERCENEISETLCMLERFFPPSFFDIMVHLTIHIAREALIGGPVQFRWMYPFERYMKVLKGYVKNRAKPEGCIAERYMAEECVRFCSEYLKQSVEIGIRHDRNDEVASEMGAQGRRISIGVPKILTGDLLEIAHRYVLFNNIEVEPYIRMHKEELKRLDKRLLRNEPMLQKRHLENFSTWLANKINTVHCVSDRLKWLANGPRQEVLSYSGYVINGQRFHTKDIERCTNNSGVSLEAETFCRSSTRDTNQIVGRISYYGVIKDIILLDYYTFQIPLFHCDWANINNGVKVEDGFTLVNLHEGLSQFEKDPYIVASQARQVAYSKVNDDSNWYVVLNVPPRGFQEKENFEENAYMPCMPQDLSRLDSNINDHDENYVRLDCEGIIV